VLLIYQDNKPTDMKASDIVTALSNVETSYPNVITGQVLVLNGYRW
jgi:hypothetical protein